MLNCFPTWRWATQISCESHSLAHSLIIILFLYKTKNKILFLRRQFDKLLQFSKWLTVINNFSNHYFTLVLSSITLLSEGQQIYSLKRNTRAYIYSGKDANGKTCFARERRLIILAQSVIKLVKHFQKTNRNITADNWFGSMALVVELDVGNGKNDNILDYNLTKGGILWIERSSFY